MSEPAIIIENVSKHYRKTHPPRRFREWLEDQLNGKKESEEFWALRNVSCRISPGKMVGLLGKNGAGKSTLLRLVGGVGRPDSGSIKSKGAIRALLDLGAGMHPDLTGTENTFLLGVVGGLTRKEVGRRLEEIVNFAGLEEFIDSPMRTYSTGMQMRLAFSIAVHTDPQILLVDEVLAVGDLAFQRKCLDRIRQIKAQGCAILLVTHDTQAVKELCDEALWLRGGESVAYGPAELVGNQYVAEMSAETQRLTALSAASWNSPANSPLKAGVNRFGSAEMEICGFRLLSTLGAEVADVESGDGVIIEIAYRAPQRVVSPIFNASIADEDYQMLIDVNTDSKANALPDLQGTGKITLRIERLDLRPRRYFISVGVYQTEWSHAYDYHWHAYPFEVHAASRQPGVLHVPHRWTLSVDEKSTPR